MKKRKFVEGGGTSVDEDPIGGVADFESQNSPESKADAESVDFGKPAGKGTEPPAGKGSISPAAAGPKSFKSAFADARSSGDKTFEWNGKKYSTAVASGAKAAPTAKETSATEKAFADTSRAKDAPAKPKYQSLQDRAEDYAAKRAASGEGMYGGKKAVSEPRKVTQVAKSDLRGPYSGMGADYKPKMRGGESFKAGGAVKGWGQARGSRAAKIV